MSENGIDYQALLSMRKHLKTFNEAEELVDRIIWDFPRELVDQVEAEGDYASLRRLAFKGGYAEGRLCEIAEEARRRGIHPAEYARIGR